MDHEEFARAAAYWTGKDATALKPMPADELRGVIDDFLAAHNTCALATAAVVGVGSNSCDSGSVAGADEVGAPASQVSSCPDASAPVALATRPIPGVRHDSQLFVRCTPLEYGWHDGAFWVFSEGGLKFVGLEPAPGETASPVALAVFEPYAGFGSLKSLQVEGFAEVVDPGSAEFAAAAAAKGIPAGRVPALAKMLHLIKIVPTSCDYLDSSLKQRGYDSRQHLDL